ncbi:MauE/DoxX family redox-associated membrane protein [Streptomyces sp. cmx-18-6]|uniref:MauE/DoxX family redox-associated membrane protein n=1 Tax=Streptomyces sp. cmx-18-6 TaxID=2790930 RepID=UPI00397FF3C0
MTYLVLFCRILLAGVFLAAFAGKIRSAAAYREFAGSVVRLGLFSRRVSRVCAAVVVGVEFLVLALLVPAGTVPAGFLAAVLLLCAFAAGIVLALRAGGSAPCRCFGASSAPLGRVHVVRNLILAVAGAGGLASAALGAGAAWPAHAGGVAVAGVAAVLGVFLVVRLDDLMSLFSSRPVMPAVGE